MLTATLGAMTMLAVAHPVYRPHTFHGRSYDDGRLLATPSPLPANGVYSVRGFGYNNREWISRGITREFQPVLDWGAPGPAHYGAHEIDCSRVFVRAGSAMVTVSPWAMLPSNGYKRAEEARVQWLTEMGYVGGVRTFRNHRAEGNDAQTSRMIPGQLRPGIDFNPAATIRLPDGVRRERPRFQVVRPVEPTESIAAADQTAPDATAGM